MLKTIVVEDEPHSRNAIAQLLTEFCPEINLLGMGSSVEEGTTLIHKHRPDLVFLDIEMHEKTGFDLLENTKGLDFEVVFTTAHDNYALKAIKLSAIDYLLKPIDIDELQTAVKKAVKAAMHKEENQKLSNMLNNLHAQQSSRHKITLSTSEGYQFVPIENILYCEADGSYTRFHLQADKKLVVSKNLKEYEHLLNGYHFYRVHQSYLVNLTAVEKYVKADGGYIVMENGTQIGISHKRRETFINLMRS